MLMLLFCALILFKRIFDLAWDLIMVGENLCMRFCNTKLMNTITCLMLKPLMEMRIFTQTEYNAMSLQKLNLFNLNKTPILNIMFN